MPYLYIVRNKHTNRIMDVHQSRRRVLFIGREEKLEQRWVAEQDLNNLYRWYARRKGRILRRPNHRSSLQ